MTDQLDDFFAEYRAGLTPEIAPAGPAAVRATVHRRRRITVTAAVATAVVLVAAPVAGYAALDRGAGPDPAPGTSQTPTPEQSTGETPPPSPSASATASATPPPDGRISRADLLESRVNLPAWAPDAPCAERGARLTDVGDEDGDIILVTVEYGDVDGDGAEETVMIVDCVYSQTGQVQVVALDRDAAGKIVTLGRIVATDRIVGDNRPEQIGWIVGIDPRSDGTVRVEVGDLRPCCGWEEEWSQRQWRTYRWNGSRFRQVAGPTVFPVHSKSIDLKVTTSDLVLATGADGRAHGGITVTITNRGPRESFNLSVSLDLGGLEVRREGTAWAACSTAQPAGNEQAAYTNCALKQRLAAGESVTLNLKVNADSVPEGLTGTAEVSHYEESFLTDLKPGDNRATFEIR